MRIDPDLQESLATAAAAGGRLDAETLHAVRAEITAMVPSTDEALAGRPVQWREASIDAGSHHIDVTVFSPHGERTRPGILSIHGGGTVVGTRHMDDQRNIELALALDAVVVTVEYRLAPEHPHPAPVEDCYRAFEWLHDEAGALGVDPERLVVLGGSAGGGLSAGVALLARDRGGPPIRGQVLLCPMIDDRPRWPSYEQHASGGTWTAQADEFAWSSLLTGSTADPSTAAALRADLGGLPPAFIEVGSAELFRDPDVALARGIWAAGGTAELHVWDGAYHGFDMFDPGAPVSRAAIDVRHHWLQRILR